MLAALGMEQAVSSSRPSLSSPSREEGSALGRLRVQETRVWSLQRSRLTLRRTSRSPQLLMDEAHHLTWPLLSRPRQCSECTLHCRPFSESDRHHPLSTDNNFLLQHRRALDATLTAGRFSSTLITYTTTRLWRGGWDGLVVFILRILWEGDQGVSE